MYISRIFIKNFRNFQLLDINLRPGVTCIIGENNTGKTNLLQALRLVIDADLSSQYRQLIEHDIYSEINIKSPQQVMVSLELSDYKNNVNESAIAGIWTVSDDKARISYRFRPNKGIRDVVEVGETPPDNLMLEDYGWEIAGGGAKDPSLVEWNEDFGKSVRFFDLQYFKVAFLQALRDVQNDFRRDRISPLRKMLDSMNIPEKEKEDLVKILSEANDAIEKETSIAETGKAIQKAFSSTAGQAFDMTVRLGIADPSFTSIARSLTVLLSNDALKNFDPSRNGLGLNNILYISMLIEYLERRVKEAKTAGQLLIIEEPEAHLHPQLQRVLYNALKNKEFQTIITTHSTHISSGSSLESMVVLTKGEGIDIASSTPAEKAKLGKNEVDDLERYLDATRSVLLYARKVILVEGPAELFLIPALIKKVMKIDIDTLGISVVPIYGVHFGVYAKLFNSLAIPKKCAIIADGDLVPSDACIEKESDEVVAEVPRLEDFNGKMVKVFYCKDTFEKALTIPGLLPVLLNACKELGAVKIVKELESAYTELRNGKVEQKHQNEILQTLSDGVLRASKRFGKARFAQVASKYVDLAEDMPRYICEAVEWLNTNGTD